MRYLIVEPPPDLMGEFIIVISAWFPGAEQSRSFPIRVIVEDVEEISRPRKIPGSPPLSVSVRAGGKITIPLSNYIEDPHGSNLSFVYDTLPPGLKVAQSGSNWTITALPNVVVGKYAINLTATNDAGQSAGFMLEVNVLAEEDKLHAPPEIREVISNQTIDVGDSLTLNLSNYFTDPDEETLAFVVESSSTGIAAANVSGDMLTIQALKAGMTTIQVSATD